MYALRYYVNVRKALTRVLYCLYIYIYIHQQYYIPPVAYVTQFPGVCINHSRGYTTDIERTTGIYVPCLCSLYFFWTQYPPESAPRKGVVYVWNVIHLTNLIYTRIRTSHTRRIRIKSYYSNTYVIATVHDEALLINKLYNTYAML
jgi:hypothetical protein